MRMVEMDKMDREMLKEFVDEWTDVYATQICKRDFIELAENGYLTEERHLVDVSKGRVHSYMVAQFGIDEPSKGLMAIHKVYKVTYPIEKEGKSIVEKAESILSFKPLSLEEEVSYWKIPNDERYLSMFPKVVITQNRGFFKKVEIAH